MARNGHIFSSRESAHLIASILAVSDPPHSRKIYHIIGNSIYEDSQEVGIWQHITV